MKKNIIGQFLIQIFFCNSGYGDRKETHIRIGNFAAHTRDDMMRIAALLTAHQRS
jgi:hypothetical protein